MSNLSITGFSPQINWPWRGATATLRYQYSDDFVDSAGQVVLRGLFKDVPCTVAAGVLSVPTHSIITTNDALVNPLVTCSARFYDANTKRAWLFEQFSIPQVLTPSTTIGALEVYNQGNELVLPPDAYLTRDQVVALFNLLIAAFGVLLGAGTVSLVNGVATVVLASVTANSKFHLTPQSPISGSVDVNTVTPGVGFTIRSTDAGDNASILWTRYIA